MAYRWSRRETLIGMAAAAGASGLPRAQAAVTKLTNSIAGQGLFYLTNYIAEDGGFFKKQGLDYQAVNVQSGPQQAAAVLGGSAQISTIGLEQNMHADSHGGNLVAICASFNAFPMALVVSRKAMQRNHLSLKNSLADNIKRLRGLRIAISSPGASTDEFIRTLLIIQGLNPDTQVHLVPVGPGGNMLAALEAGSVDGFVWGPPFSTEAASKGLADIIVDPMKGTVPQFNNYAYLAITTSRQTLARQRPLLLAAVRGYTAAMRFAHSEPDQARALVRHRFATMDDGEFKAAFDEFLAGVPKSPLISEAQFDQTLKTLNLTTKQPLRVTYQQVVVTDLAREALRS